MINIIFKKPYKSLSVKLSLFLILLLTTSSSLWSDSFFQASDSSVEVTSESEAMMKGDELLLGLNFKLTPGWHTYWKNPGDAGEGASVTWQLPKGFQASEILWPGPEAIPVEPLMTFGYEDEITLLTKIKALDAAVFPAIVKAKVSWYTCKDICVPQEANLELTIQNGEKINTFFANELSNVFLNLPKELSSKHRVEALDDNYFLQMELDGNTPVSSAYFFPEEYGLSSYSKEQILEINKNSLSLQISQSEVDLKLQNFAGVLLLNNQDSRTFFNVNLNLNNNQKQESLSISELVLTIIFAFIGGLILNAMPCVFPILSIKILNFVEQSEGSKEKMIQHGLSFSAGVLVTFLSIAGLLLLLKSGGESIGWGYQLQSPLMVTILIYLFVAIGITFMSNLVLGGQLAQLGNINQGYGDITSSFLTGVLAVIVASPCTAPFMGSAVGIALLQPGFITIAIFVSLGLGFAAPYLLLSFYPSLLKVLPKPGAWMETLKQFMAFPMWGSALWLTWVLSGQVQTDSVLMVLLGALFIALGLWILEKNQSSDGFAKWMSLSSVTILLGAALWLAPTDYENIEQDTSSDLNSYSPELLDSLLAENKPVFLNFTADWCITCKVNEAVVLNQVSIKNALESKGIVYLKADWTRKDETIANKLAEYGRTGVPLYLLYSSEGIPVILPELLTEDMLLSYIETIK
ncbi:protein-disulfide reductase DsbD family protein [Gammaproteobacteria bacterium]|nr:protein-disulfide reductase DsbD family protein [Gammaproteobacteria bacterium]|tara:strand:+ start:3378 stop:5450 length:2073 start_codon:yes stop_codon:yes gene_type:complete